MKIISWNCNMAFRKKAAIILTYKPDIVIIQECENPTKLNFGKDTPQPKQIYWHGTNSNKGIGVFAYSDYLLKLHASHNPDLKNILPIIVENDKIKFLLFAIWANNPLDKDGCYITQVWKALHFYDKLIKKTKTILIGDFNSNSIWDKPRKIGDHSDVVTKLKSKNIFSTYHKFYNQSQGKEEHPTLFMYRHETKSYHIDYCFATKDFIDQILDLEIGEFKDWKLYSDHCPFIITFSD